MKMRSILFFICLFVLTLSLSRHGETHKSSRLYPIVKNGKYGYIDKTGDIVIKPQFDSAKDFFEGLAVVRAGALKSIDRIEIKGMVFQQKIGGYGYIDASGKIVIEPRFDRAFGFSEGFGAVEINGKTGYIDKKAQLDGAAHPSASRIALGRIQNRVSGKNRPARIEVRSRQIEASRIRKPPARSTTKGGTHMDL